MRLLPDCIEITDFILRHHNRTGSSKQHVVFQLSCSLQNCFSASTTVCKLFRHIGEALYTADWIHIDADGLLQSFFQLVYEQR